MKMLRLLVARLLIMVLGVASAWLIARIFIDAETWAPWFVALLVTYGIAAYVILPRLVRASMRLLRKEAVPTYTTTADGLPGDPVNLALVGTLPQLRAAFRKIGWVEADALGMRSSIRMARAFVFKEPYPAAPFSTLYLFGRGQNIGLQRPIGGSPRRRDHVRFWGMPLDQAQKPGTPDRGHFRHGPDALIEEREHGMIEHLLVMPVTPTEIMISKIWSMALAVRHPQCAGKIGVLHRKGAARHEPPVHDGHAFGSRRQPAGGIRQ